MECLSFVARGADGQLTAPVQDLLPAGAKPVSPASFSDSPGAGKTVDDRPADIRYSLNCESGVAQQSAAPLRGWAACVCIAHTFLPLGYAGGDDGGNVTCKVVSDSGDWVPATGTDNVWRELLAGVGWLPLPAWPLPD